MMKRRNYLQSVASLPVLSGVSLPSLPESESEDDSELPYTIDSMWHRGNEEGTIHREGYFHYYTEYDQWKASTVVFSSLFGVDIVPKLSRIEDTHLISVTDHQDGHTRVLLTAENEELDISLSTRYMREVKFHHYDGKNYYIKCENLAYVKNEIEERI